MNTQILAELSGVTKRFGKVVALDGLTLEVMHGELLAVLGPNGAGKTTAISLLLGLQQPDKGSARLFGQAPGAIEARRQVGVMMQEAALPPELRVREQIDLIASYYPAPLTAAEAMSLTGIQPLANRPYGALSGGQKRQVQFAIAIVGRPRLLFLDEPTVGLDLQSRELVWATLRRLVRDGCSIVLTTHYLEEAEALADRVAVLAKGRLIATGTVSEMRALVVRKRITCRTTLQAAQVAEWPDVQTVNTDHHGLHITASNTENVVRRLLAADEDLQDLEVQRAGLAEAFTELTQEVAQ
ncbi:ABC transporter ATP-binding protein [uncultured Paludibaculum sp.]|uniref:ABC transporter ATP-binding protein n=1 Tax=uncultured Paludibaculum sp. TaxID=1765020 RepID=UPI002AAB2749|nr:ABC transporter ATP-binding protein [uncultured Paludibaculum sp.]